VLSIAGHDLDRAERVLLWPLRDMLESYVWRLRRDATDTHRHDMLVWALLAPHQKRPDKPPRRPEILRDE
jgi:hypothetical protein